MVGKMVSLLISSSSLVLIHVVIAGMSQYSISWMMKERRDGVVFIQWLLLLFLITMISFEF